MRFPILLITALVISAPASAKTLQETVGDKNEQVVLSSQFKTCVRTKWQAGNDVCAAEVPVVQAPPPPAPAKELSHEQRSVYFDFNKSTITEHERNKLDSLASVLKSDQNVKSVKVLGFADRIGSQDYNQKLSQKRAETVGAYLKSRGYLNVSGAELRWLGEDSPKAECADNLKRAELISCLAKTAVWKLRSSSFKNN